ncbi:MAG: DUF4236 domain-containing protein [Actinomycetota bacterium]
MGFRIRKSFKITKGVRLNISKTGLGMSFGVPGARYAVRSTGSRTVMIGNPIFGVGYMKTTGGESPSSRPSGPRPAAVLPHPGLLAPKADKALFKAVQANDPAAIEQVGNEFPEYRTIALTLAGVMTISQDKASSTRMLAEVFSRGEDPANHPFVRRYMGASLIHAGIAPGVTVELPICRDALGLLLGELYQDAGNRDSAVDVVEQIDPSAYAAVSLAELYCETGRYMDAVEVTEGLSNEDDATALLCTYRGLALRELGHLDASLAVFREALKSRSRSPEIRHLALSERARTYEAMGKRSMARKDLERILAEDSGYDGLQDRLAELQGR